ncbi:MAG: hypothetical protein HYZ51_02835 [Candidatus Doudnabacteria bacterium]|nr:hypothetical protein [Candidatus Doudnabacteria bacterium]
MGKVKENLLTKGFSGRIGDEIVFRQVGNRTLFAKRPRKRTTISPNQQPQRELFRQAVLFAKTMLLDPLILADYKDRARLAGLASAYSAAMTDYLRAPQISSISTDYYKGAVGDVIWIIALDDFKLQKVSVVIQKADGSMLEQGDAVLEEGRWKYVATQAEPLPAGLKVVVTATDRPGKVAILEKLV